MCYSHLGNGVRNGAISITEKGFISDYYKVKPIGQYRKILVMAMGFVDHLGHILTNLLVQTAHHTAAWHDRHSSGTTVSH